MQKSHRDHIIYHMSQDEREEFRRLLREIRTEMKAASGRRILAKDVLEARGGDLALFFRAGLEMMIERDLTGPNEGAPPPDFCLKRMGSEARVRLSHFQGKRPVALIFGSYT